MKLIVLLTIIVIGTVGCTLDQNLKRAAEYYDQHKYDKALEEVNKSLENNSEQVTGWSLKADILFDQQKYEEALVCFDNALAYDSSNEEVLCRKGDTLLALKKYKDADVVYSLIVAENPERYDVWCGKGVALSGMGLASEAVKSIKKSLIINDKYGMAYMHLGIVYNRMRSFEKALLSFNNAIKHGKKGWDTYYNRAYSFYATGRYDNAIKNFSKALKLAPGRAYIYSDLGVTYAKKKNFNTAIQYYKEALQVNGSYWEAHYNLACIYSKLDMQKDALLSLESALIGGCKMFEHIKKDTDLENIRNLKEFKVLIEKYKK